MEISKVRQLECCRTKFKRGSEENPTRNLNLVRGTSWIDYTNVWIVTVAAVKQVCSFFVVLIIFAKI